MPKTELAQSRLVRREPIGDDLLRFNRLVPQQAAEQLQGRVGVSSALNDYLQGFAFIVHGAP